MAADSPWALVAFIVAGLIGGAAVFAAWRAGCAWADKTDRDREVRRLRPSTPGGASRGETGPHLPEGRSPQTSFRQYHARIRRQIRRAKRDIYRDVRGGRR